MKIVILFIGLGLFAQEIETHKISEAHLNQFLSANIDILSAQLNMQTALQNANKDCNGWELKIDGRNLTCIEPKKLDPK